MSVTAPNYMKLFAAQREEAIAESVITYTVPVTAGKPLEIHAEFNPLPLKVVVDAQERIEKAKPGTRGVVILKENSGILVKACRRIWGQIEDGTQIPLRVDWETNPEGYTKFDPDAAKFLGLPEGSTANDVVLSIFVIEGHIAGAAGLITKESGFAEQEADGDIAGK